MHFQCVVSGNAVARIENRVESNRLRRARLNAFDKTIACSQDERIHRDDGDTDAGGRWENTMRSGGLEGERTWADPQRFFPANSGL
jgi:hypothetical protein